MLAEICQFLQTAIPGKGLGGCWDTGQWRTLLWGRKVSDLGFAQFMDIMAWVAFKRGKPL